MEYKVSNASDMYEVAEKIKHDNEKTYSIVSAVGKSYYIDFDKYEKGIQPFWVRTTPNTETENPYYTEEVVVDELVEVEEDDEFATEEEIVEETAPETVVESDNTEIEEKLITLENENEMLRKENEALKEKLMVEAEEVSVADVLEYVSLAQFIEFVVTHSK